MRWRVRWHNVEEMKVRGLPGDAWLSVRFSPVDAVAYWPEVPGKYVEWRGNEEGEKGRSRRRRRWISVYF